jgi:hypothetical protein
VRLHGFRATGAWVLIFGSLAVGHALAQGAGHEHHGVANNTCPLIVAGMHEMHVAAYHPSTGLFQELCMEVPGTGKITITLDAIGNEIRSMTTEIKVVKGDGTVTDAVQIAHLPAQAYPAGVTTFNVDLDEPGTYALLVTLREGEMEMTGTHVLRVADPWQKWLYVGLVAAAGLVAVGGLFAWHERGKKLVPGKR